MGRSTEFEVNQTLVSKSAADALFSNGFALYAAFATSGLFLLCGEVMSWKRERKADSMGQLNRWQVLSKCGLPGFSFGSELLLIAGMFAESRALACVMLGFRLLHVLGVVFVLVSLLGSQWVAPYVKRVVVGADTWKDQFTYDFAKDSIPLVGVLIILCMGNVSLVQMLPRDGSMFYRESKGFPNKSLSMPG